MQGVSRALNRLIDGDNEDDMSDVAEDDDEDGEDADQNEPEAERAHAQAAPSEEPAHKLRRQT